MWRLLLFLSLSFNLSPNLWSVDLGKYHCHCLLYYPASYDPAHSFINIYLHLYTALFYVPLLYVWTHPHLRQNHLNLIAILDFTFLSPPSSPSLHPGGLFFPGSVQPSTARPLSPRRASFPSCSLCVRMVSGMSLASCSIKTPRESTYALFLICPLSMTKMGSNGFSSHYMVWTAVTITTCNSDLMSC